jgi:CHRD domain-containing protein
MTRKRAYLTLGAAFVVGLVAASIALADHGHGNGNGNTVSAHLIGFNETPSLNSTGDAQFTATLASDKITFQLKYSGLSGPPLFAHVHIGQRGVAGGVSFFLCGGGSKPACPASTSGTVSGTVVASDVIGPIAQGFDAGDLTSVLKAIKGGVAYANMHTMKFPAGEIRGQLRGGGGHDDG